MPEQDYLVIYEEDVPEDEADTAEDRVVLAVAAAQAGLLEQVDIETDIDLDITNTPNRLGLAGLIVSILGAILGFVALFWFSTSYPYDWFVDGNRVETPAQKGIAAVAALAALVLLAGTVMTAFGRRMAARGALKEMHIVEKQADASASNGHGQVR